VIPAELQSSFEKFLILGFSGCLAFFVACGVGIGVEAFAVSSKQPLSPEMDKFIV
ncbi:unnamed protein product, partial [Choristocarpus tenellus]